MKANIAFTQKYVQYILYYQYDIHSELSSEGWPVGKLCSDEYLIAAKTH